jgi:pimeloyl-ACP methyl ester carboxylesterase
MLWETFRIGPPGSYASAPEARRAWPNSRFPAKAFDQFAKQVMPRFSTADQAAQASYDALLERVGPCILISHSAAGPFAARAAMRAPHLVKAHVAIEPSGGVELPAPDALAAVPHLFVWGDHVSDQGTDPTWAQLYQSSRRMHEALVVAGPSAWLDLPDRGVQGNSHLLMMDDNSDAICDLIIHWLRAGHLPRQARARRVA